MSRATHPSLTAAQADALAACLLDCLVTGTATTEALTAHAEATMGRPITAMVVRHHLLALCIRGYAIAHHAVGWRATDMGRRKAARGA